MARLNKAINGLKHCSSGLGCYGCPYSEGHESTTHCQVDNARDARAALEVLKKQVKDYKQQKPLKGHWIEKEDYNMDTYYDCSVCGESWTTIEGTPWENGMNYCPHCGANMR